jgi:hypothetical protein
VLRPAGEIWQASRDALVALKLTFNIAEPNAPDF